jgi:hypothetical protein
LEGTQSRTALFTANVNESLDGVSATVAGVFTLVYDFLELLFLDFLDFLDFLESEDELPRFFLDPFLEPFLDDVCVVDALRDFLAYASLVTTAHDINIINREKIIDMCFLKFISI